jgi:formiminoglutamase
MSAPSSSAAGWCGRLDPVAVADVSRPDDPRLGRFTTFGQATPDALRPGRPVLLGFPQEEGVRRNGGRPGAAGAPARIRHWLYRLTPWDGQHNCDLASLELLDLGDVRTGGSLEESQEALGEVVGAVLAAGAIPIVLGGGHETAFGHYLGWHRLARPLGIVNLDAHLDVRPCIEGRGHSGSPFRQALEHPRNGTEAPVYACLGAQPQAVSREHVRWLQERGGEVFWASALQDRRLRETLAGICQRLEREGRVVWVSLDADVVRAADVPGVSAPNPLGLDGREVAALARVAGTLPAVRSFDLVEINPSFDVDDRSARWAAVVVWSFLSGLADRRARSSALPGCP